MLPERGEDLRALARQDLDAVAASDAAMTPIAPASERRVVDWALWALIVVRARGAVRCAKERGAFARKACTSTLARSTAQPTVRAAERGIVSAVERVDKVEECVGVPGVQRVHELGAL